MRFLTCLYGFRGSQAQISAILAFLFILSAGLDLLFGGSNKFMIVFDVGCLFAGILEIGVIRNKITNYFMIYGLRFYQYLLMLLTLGKAGIGFYISKEIHSYELVFPIFMLLLIFMLTAMELKQYKLYQESKQNGRSIKSFN